MEIYEGGVIYSTNISLPLNRDSLSSSRLFLTPSLPPIFVRIFPRSCPFIDIYFAKISSRIISSNFREFFWSIHLSKRERDSRIRGKRWRFPRFYLGWISDISRFQVFLLTILSNRVKLVKIFHRSLIRTSRSRFRSFLKNTLIHEFMMILEAREGEVYRRGRFFNEGKEKNPVTAIHRYNNAGENYRRWKW